MGIRLDIREICRNVEAVVVFSESVSRIGRIREEETDTYSGTSQQKIGAATSKKTGAGTEK